jgi:hypothetical protein
MPSTMLTYVIASIPPATLIYLQSPAGTAVVEATLAPVLADAITIYDPSFTLEAQCTDKVRFNAIGRALFWQWALESIQAADVTGGASQASSEFSAHVAEITRLRDWYYSQVPGGMPGPAVEVGTIIGSRDPYVYPRHEDRI